MAPLTDLLSCSIIEKDSNGDILWTWSYPRVAESQKAVVARKCNLELEHNSSQVFVFSRHKHSWFYIHCSEVFDSDKLPKVSCIFFKIEITVYLMNCNLTGKAICINFIC